jgi:ferredoxin-NADP reductase
MAKTTNRKCHICGPGGWMDYFLNHLKAAEIKADKMMIKIIKNGINTPKPKDQKATDEQLEQIRNGKGICGECYEQYVIPAKFGLKSSYGHCG